MTKTCPSCEVTAPPDARYCRHCGAPLQRLGASGDAAGVVVSPIAATVPLSGQHPTDEIVAGHDVPLFAPHTSEVTREEMLDLLSRRGAPTGELRDVEPGAAGDGQTASTRDGRDGRDGRGVHNSATAHRAESLHADSAHGYAPGDFDPEQTQITISVRPLTSRNLPADAAAAHAAAATSSAARANGKPQFNNAPQQVTLSPTGSLQPASPPPPVASSTAAARAPAQPNEARAFRVWAGMGLALVSIVIIGCLGVALWLGVRGFRRVSETAPPAAAVGGEVAPPAAADPRQLADAKLAEADALIASGNATEAVARLREAAVLDPENAEPHRRLARLLLASGSRREAVEELRAVARLAPGDAEVWRSLASAQFAEGLYEDALESYRGLGEASPGALARDPVQLAYADALRLAGRAGEARVIYRRLAASPDAEVAAASKRHLGQPTPADDDAADTQTDAAARAAEAASRTPEAVAPASPAPPPPTTTATAATAATRADNSLSSAPARASGGSPSEQYARGVGLWATNRGAAVAEFRAAAERGNSDASYYLGLSIAEGRDPRALKRAELVAAIVHFGRARRGKFRGQSVTYEEQLGRELDRRRNPQTP